MAQVSAPAWALQDERPVLVSASAVVAHMVAEPAAADTAAVDAHMAVELAVVDTAVVGARMAVELAAVDTAVDTRVSDRSWAEDTVVGTPVELHMDAEHSAMTVDIDRVCKSLVLVGDQCL